MTLHSRIAFLFFLLFCCSCQNRKNTLEKLVETDLYPSASGIETDGSGFWAAGDNVNYLLKLDSNFSPVDSLLLYSVAEKNIPKPVKPDFESITRLWNNKLLVLGSGSLSPSRNKGWLIDTESSTKDSILLDSFYARLQAMGIHEINIEGATAIPGGILLANRGNKSYPKNHLLLAAPRFWEDMQSSPLHIALIGTNTDSTLFSGVSGLAYAQKSDWLVATVSTEDTKSSFEDGAIGKSYIWLIKDISAKKNWAAINPDMIIDLEKTDPRFKGHKIESVCIIEETDKSLRLALAADNDDGSSAFFRLLIVKR